MCRSLTGEYTSAVWCGSRYVENQSLREDARLHAQVRAHTHIHTHNMCRFLTGEYTGAVWCGSRCCQRIDACLHTQVYILTTDTHIHIHRQTQSPHSHTSTRTHIHAHTRTHAQVYILTHKHTNMHARTHTHTHTHTHTRRTPFTLCIPLPCGRQPKAHNRSRRCSRYVSIIPGEENEYSCYSYPHRCIDIVAMRTCFHVM